MRCICTNVRQINVIVSLIYREGNVLNILGERVLTCDTDSVKYISTRDAGEYQVTPGTALGQ